jgi:hypothetical protein
MSRTVQHSQGQVQRQVQGNGQGTIQRVHGQANVPANGQVKAQANGQTNSLANGQAKAQANGQANGQDKGQTKAKGKGKKGAATQAAVQNAIQQVAVQQAAAQAQVNGKNKNVNAGALAAARYKALMDFAEFGEKNKEVMECLDGCGVYATMKFIPLATSGHIKVSDKFEEFLVKLEKLIKPLVSEDTHFLVPQHAVFDDVSTPLMFMDLSHRPGVTPPHDVGGGKVRRMLLQKFEQAFTDAKKPFTWMDKAKK